MVEDARHHGDASRPDEETISDTAESLLTFENAAIPLAVICPVGRIVMANRALRAVLGYEFEEIVGMSIFELVVLPVDDPHRAWQEWVSANDGVTPERRVRLVRKDRSHIAVRASSVVVADDQGAARYVVTRAALEIS
ncbi:MAG: fold [Acidimicrobiales bacterium]|jgi:PAS domain S-box-containing protein|nr:fold [Acidimicrobiales bacterium]